MFQNWNDRPSETEKTEASRPGRNTIAILETVAKADEPITLSAISRATGVPKATAFRYLQALVEEGYVVRDSSGRGHVLGAKVLELSHSFYARYEPLSMASRAIAQLADETGETAHLGVLNVPDVVYIDIAESPRRIRAFAKRGDRLPAYCVAAGHAILAHLDGSAVEAVITAGMPRRTPSTIVDAKSFREAISDARRRGYAITSRQWMDDVVGISAPIFFADGRIAGAIGVSCPAARTSAETIGAHARAVRTCAEQLSTAAGLKQGEKNV